MGGETTTAYYILANKNPSIRNGLSLLSRWSVAVSLKINITAIAIAFGYLPELDGC